MKVHMSMKEKLIQHHIQLRQNEKNDGNTQPNNGLGEYSYNSMAGWMISVNGDNDNGNLTPADIVKDGDVIRYQFQYMDGSRCWIKQLCRNGTIKGCMIKQL